MGSFLGKLFKKKGHHEYEMPYSSQHGYFNGGFTRRVKQKGTRVKKSRRRH